MPRLLFWMRMDVDYFELIEPELLSVCALFGVPNRQLNLSYSRDGPGKLYSEGLKSHYSALSRRGTDDFKRLRTTEQNVFLYGTVPNEETARLIFERSILVKAVANIWNTASSYDQLLDRILTYNKKEINTYLTGKRWCVKFSSYNSRSSQTHIDSVLDKLSPVFGEAGEVSLADPETRILIIEKYRLDSKTREKELDCVYFGNVLFGRFDHLWWNAFSLSTRPILGPTSLETSLSFIMSNLGKVTSDTVVYDPFVGSGGALVSSSIFKGFCLGSDIDLRILRGWGTSYKNPNCQNDHGSTNIFVNFEHYKLDRPEVIRADIRHPPFKQTNRNCHEENEGWVDTIISDPPYGIRSSFTHSKLMKNVDNSLKNEDCFELIEGLLDIGVLLLVKGGRLVFLLPGNVNRLDSSLRVLDRADYELVHIGQQTLSGGATRFIVTLEKL